MLSVADPTTATPAQQDRARLYARLCAVDRLANPNRTDIIELSSTVLAPLFHLGGVCEQIGVTGWDVAKTRLIFDKRRVFSAEFLVMRRVVMTARDARPRNEKTTTH